MKAYAAAAVISALTPFVGAALLAAIAWLIVDYRDFTAQQRAKAVRRG